MTGLTGLLPHEAGARAVRAAQALLHQPGATDAAEAWQVVGTLDRLGAELRAACEAANGSAQGVVAAPWLAPAAALVTRLEEAFAWWTGQARFPWASWDETASSELGMLLCELDALAAGLLNAAAPPAADALSAAAPPAADALSAAAPPAADVLSAAAPPAADVLSAAAPPVAFASSPPAAAGAPAFCDAAAAIPTASGTPTAFVASTASAPLAQTRPHRRPSARLLPSLGLAAAAVVGVIGGITYAATHAGPGSVPHRAIASVPVPFTLHDGNGVPPGTQVLAAAPASLPATSDPVSAIGVPGNIAQPTSTSGAASSPAAPDAGATAAAPDPAPPSPQQATPRPRPHSGPPIPAVNLYQAQLELLAAAIRAAREQETDPRLRSFSQHVQIGFPPIAP